MTRWSLFLQTLSLLLHHFLGLYSSPGRNGPVEYEGAIVIDSLTTTERNAITLTGTGGLGASGNGLVILQLDIKCLSALREWGLGELQRPGGNDHRQCGPG